jgi:hypothetical protein
VRIRQRLKNILEAQGKAKLLEEAPPLKKNRRGGRGKENFI